MCEYLSIKEEIKIMKGSDAVIEMLIAHGVEHVFGVPGDTSMQFHNSFFNRKECITQDRKSVV